MINGHDDDFLTPQVGREGRPSSSGFSDQQGSSYHVPGPSGHYQGSARTIQPDARSHDGRTLNGHSDARSHLYNGYQLSFLPDTFSSLGDTCPTPPIAWHNDSHYPSQNKHEDTQPSASSSYGVADPRTHFARHNPSPYATDAPNLNPYPWPPGKVRPVSRGLQAQPSPGKKRSSPVTVIEDEVEDAENSEGEEDGKANKEKHSAIAKGEKKSKKTSAKKEVRRGLTRLNAGGELEWLATANSEGGKVSPMGLHLR